jgi:hypothetical protein
MVLVPVPPVLVVPAGTIPAVVVVLLLLLVMLVSTADIGFTQDELSPFLGYFVFNNQCS